MNGAKSIPRLFAKIVTRVSDDIIVYENNQSSKVLIKVSDE